MVTPQEELLPNEFSPLGPVTHNSTLNGIKFAVSYSLSTYENQRKSFSGLKHSHIKALSAENLRELLHVRNVMSCSSGLFPKNTENSSKTMKLLVQAA